MKESSYINYENEKELKIGDYKLNDLTYCYGSPILLFNNIEANEIIKKLNKQKENYKNINYILDLDKIYIPFNTSLKYIANSKNYNYIKNNYYIGRNFSSNEILEALNNGIRNFIIENNDQIELLKIILNHLNIKEKINLIYYFQVKLKSNTDLSIFSTNELKKIKDFINFNIMNLKGVCIKTDLSNEENINEIFNTLFISKELFDVEEIIFINSENNTKLNYENLFKIVDKCIKNYKLEIQINFEISNLFKSCFYLITSIGNQKEIIINKEKITCLYLDYDLCDNDFNNSIFTLNFKAIIKDKNYLLFNKNRKSNEKTKQFKYDIISRGDILLFKNFDIENFFVFSKLNNMKDNVFLIDFLNNKIEINKIN